MNNWAQAFIIEGAFTKITVVFAVCTLSKVSVHPDLSYVQCLSDFAEENQRQAEFYKKRGIPMPNGDIQSKFNNLACKNVQEEHCSIALPPYISSGGIASLNGISKLLSFLCDG